MTCLRHHTHTLQTFKYGSVFVAHPQYANSKTSAIAFFSSKRDVQKGGVSISQTIHLANCAIEQ